MKILITSDWYTAAANGVVTSILNLRRELEARGHEVRVLTLSQSPRSSRREGVTYIGSLSAGLVYPGARLRTALGSGYVRELLRWGPDIVHSQCEFSTFFLARKIAEELDIPLVHTYHTVYEDYTHYFSPIQKWGHQTVALLSRWITNRTDCVIAPTEKVKRLLLDYGVQTEVQVIPTGIDLRAFAKSAPRERLTELRKQLKIPEDCLCLVCVGRLAEEKNISELLHYVAVCRDTLPVVLLLVGDGPFRRELEQQAGEPGLENRVVFAGAVPRAQVADYYHLGDLFVSASTSETQGLTYIEALASGLPALCRADPCLSGVILNGENGWQYHTQQEFLEHLNWFAAHLQDRRELRDNAVKVAGGFSAELFAQRVEKVYQEQIAKFDLRRETDPAAPSVGAALSEQFPGGGQGPFRGRRVFRICEEDISGALEGKKGYLLRALRRCHIAQHDGGEEPKQHLPWLRQPRD